MTGLTNKGQKAVANWIYIGVAMLLVQVILGGITRLTGSGLSITEWNVVTGGLPPLNDYQWAMEFDKYKHTPQYLLLNADFNLGNFKFIFFWEWFHRFWARMIGVVFIVGFSYLLVKKFLKPEMVKPLLILFLLGAMQGAIGWIMVKSGLTGDSVYVKPVKLALHFVFALGLICYAWWFALQLSVPANQIIKSHSIRQWTRLVIVILFFQLIYGALMAGHKAANAASTWPTINGSWLPADSFSSLVKIVDNKITIHFIHRGLAYLLLFFTILWTFGAIKANPVSGYFSKTRWLPFILIMAQVILGVMAVLSSTSIVANHWGPFEWIAQAHQVIGMLYLLLMVWMLYIVRAEKYPV